MINWDINIDTAGRAPLYSQRPGDAQPDMALLEMTEDGNVSVCTRPRSAGTPMLVWHHRTLEWNLSPHLTAEQVRALPGDTELCALLEAVHAGHGVEWDGANYVGRLTEDADRAYDKVQEYLDSIEPEAQVWEVGDWLTAGGRNHFQNVWPARFSLGAIIRDLEAEAEDEGIVLIGDIREYLLRWLRDEVDSGYEPEGEHVTALNPTA